MDKKTMMEKLAHEAFEKGGFNGAWLYAENGEIVSKGAAGWRDPEGTTPIGEDTIFQLASVSKQFTAAAVMLAVRRGLLSLDDELAAFFPELDKYKGATIRHLLTHTSGIPDYFDDADWFINIWKKENRVPGNPEIVRFLCETETEPYGAPGETFQYSNTGYNLLAEIVERVSETPFEEFLQKNIFEPAGMKNTRCCHIRRDGVPFENYAQATVIRNDTFVADMDPEGEPDVIAFEGLNGDDYVFTNLFDLFRWDRVLREGSVLTLEEQKLMYTPVVLNSGETYRDEDGEGYGFGWGVLTEEDFGLIVRHSGGMPGVGTWFERFIDADRVLVILTNRDIDDARVFKSCDNGMEAIARDKEPEPVVTIDDVVIKDPDKSNWKSFCGKYERPEDEDFIIEEVFMKDGDLYANAINDEGEKLSFKLYPIGENEFGRKRGMIKLTFRDGVVEYIGNSCKKV